IKRPQVCTAASTRRDHRADEDSCVCTCNTNTFSASVAHSMNARAQLLVADSHVCKQVR
ncbi:hypothetical protein BaRGS_00033643, partial [Batillaria attramentaria]